MPDYSVLYVTEISGHNGAARTSRDPCLSSSLLTTWHDALTFSSVCLCGPSLGGPVITWPVSMWSLSLTDVFELSDPLSSQSFACIYCLYLMNFESIPLSVCIAI